jgi:hypothetical protein
VQAAEKAEKEAAVASTRLAKAGGTALCWDLHILLNLVAPHKDAGAKCFGVGDHAGAYDAYQTAVDVAHSDPTLLRWPPIEALVITCHANAALCGLKLGRNAAALKHCEDALALPGANACGKALLSKLLVRKLTALCEMDEDPLEAAAPRELTRALRDAHTRGLASGKFADKGAAKLFAELVPRVAAYPYDLDEPPDEVPTKQTRHDAHRLVVTATRSHLACCSLSIWQEAQPLFDVVRILVTAFHPERTDDSIRELLSGLTEILDYQGMTPPSSVAVTDKNESLLYGLAEGLKTFPEAAHSETRVTFYVDALEARSHPPTPWPARPPRALACAYYAPCLHVFAGVARPRRARRHANPRRCGDSCEYRSHACCHRRVSARRRAIAEGCAAVLQTHTPPGRPSGHTSPHRSAHICTWRTSVRCGSVVCSFAQPAPMSTCATQLGRPH